MPIVSNVENELPLAEILYKFRCLKKLQISIHSDLNIVELDSMIQDCPLLEELTLVPYLPCIKLGNHAVEHPSWIQSRPNIHTLLGDIAIHNDDSIEYLMHKFPQLNQLELNDTYNFELMGAISMAKQQRYIVSKDVMLTFFEYLSEIPRYSIGNIYMKEGIINVLVQFMNNYKTPISLFLNHVEAMCTHGIEPHLAFSGFPNDSVNISVSLNCEEDERVLPHAELIEKIGFKLTTLKIFYKGKQAVTSEDDDNYDMTYGNFIAHALKHRPNLQSLSVTMLEFYTCPEDVEIHSSLTKLEISVGSICDPSIMTKFSAQLPSLKYLILEASGCCCNGDPANVTLDMPFTSFDTEFAGCDNNTKFCLKVVSIDVGERNYFAENGLKMRLMSSEEYQNMNNKGCKLSLLT